MDLNTLYQRHATAMGLFILVVIFGYGLVESVVLKDKKLACTTWFVGILAIACMIAYPPWSGLWSIIRILGGVVAFVFGMVLLVVYYKWDDEGENE